MNIAIFPYPVKIIYWEYHKTPETITHFDHYQKYTATAKPGTKTINGILFTSTVRFHKGDFVSLSCICTQRFGCENLQSISFADAKSLLGQAFDDFNNAFQIEYKKYAKCGSILNTVKDADVFRLMQYLREL